MKVAIVIPARYASVRLPGKPLLKETGKYLIQHVYEAAQKSQQTSVIAVATDDQKIYDAVEAFGGKVFMTSAEHPSGTDRIAEVATHLDADIFINVQGDEPEILPESIDLVASILQQNSNADISTLAFPIDANQAKDPDLVKVVFDVNGAAMYFSRSAIPYHRDQNMEEIPEVYWGHVGIYGYRREFLKIYSSLEPTNLEKMEKLEQLRALENGYKIYVGKVQERTIGIDTPEDYKNFVKRMQA